MALGSGVARDPLHGWPCSVYRRHVARPRKSSLSAPTPERLLAAALVEFSRVGYTAARLEDIAAAAGIRRPSLLHHFETKEALYAATVERAADAMGAALTASMAVPGGFEERMRSLVDGFEAFAEANPAVARLLVRELISDGHGPGRDTVTGRIGPLIDVVSAWANSLATGSNRPSLRASLVTVASECLLRAAMGEAAVLLWGLETDLWARVRPMLVHDQAETPG